MSGTRPNRRTNDVDSCNHRKQGRHGVKPQQSLTASLIPDCNRPTVRKASAATASAHNRSRPEENHQVDGLPAATGKAPMLPTKPKPKMSDSDGSYGPSISHTVSPAFSHVSGPTQMSGQPGDNFLPGSLSCLIATKFDSVINAIDEETFSGQERDLSRLVGRIDY